MSIPNIPTGRTENYLGNLIGQETAWEPGNPESRVEEYLDYILENGTKLEQEMEDEIANLKAIGRFLSLWNAATGLPTTNPSKLPYKYKAGDYYIVSVVGDTNYQPTGNKYEGTASTTVYSDTLAINDFFVYDGTNWTLLSHSQVDLYFPGDNIDITDGTISVSSGEAPEGNLLAADGSGSATWTNGIPYLTTAPTSNNTDAGLKIVVLEYDPATKYEGYLYIIAPPPPEIEYIQNGEDLTIINAPYSQNGEILTIG
jgi:hypothetical protein